MTNDIRPRYAGVSEALPVALVVWKVGQRLHDKAGNHPVARAWARVGMAGAALVGLAALAVGLVSGAPRTATQSASDRLDEELAESFPASDAPAVTRAG